MDRKIVVSTLVLTLTLGLLAGFLADGPASRVPPVLAAACQAAHGLCNYGTDHTRTATLNVEHSTSGGSTTPVEPASGETWTITAYWDTATGVPCLEHSETASVDVDWNGSSWVVSNKSTTSNILDMKVCTTDTGCQSGGTLHDSGYQLAVDITNPVTISGTPYNLRLVTFTSSSVDDGYELNLGTCTLGNSVTPTSDSFSQSDAGPFECDFACQSGAPTVNITYE